MSDKIRETRTAAFAACPETGCDWSSFWRGWQAALAQQPAQAVPDGWKLVPVEPTEEMLDALFENGMQDEDDDLIRSAYSALISVAPAAPVVHTDDAAVDRFATRMKAKLAAARAKGRGGLDDPAQCSVESLAALLVEHLRKGNAGTFEDVANFSMMLHQRGADPRVLADAAAPAAQEPVIGWAFHNPDTGWEWHEDHPVESGMAEDATGMRQMSLEQFRQQHGYADAAPPAAEHPTRAMQALATISRMARNEACRSGAPSAGQLCTWDAIADMADAALAESPAAEQPACPGCNGHGLVGGFVSAESGYDAEECPFCCGDGFIHGTECGACAEQPDTVAVPRELLAEAESIIDSYAEALKASHAPGGDWDGEEAALDDYEREAGVAEQLRRLLGGAE